MPTGRPDWFGTIVAAGKYDTKYKAIALDESGAILALMKGAYGSFLKTIAVDENSVMKANLSVQDLDFLTVRPAYGQARQDSGGELIPSGAPTRLKRVGGRGIIVCGRISWGASATRKDLWVKLEIDDTEVTSRTPNTLNELNIFHPGRSPTFVTRYDDNEFNYGLCINPLLTFESSFEIIIYHNYGTDQNVTFEIMWALVP